MNSIPQQKRSAITPPLRHPLVPDIPTHSLSHLPIGQGVWRIRLKNPAHPHLKIEQFYIHFAMRGPFGEGLIQDDKSFCRWFHFEAPFAQERPKSDDVQS